MGRPARNIDRRLEKLDLDYDADAVFLHIPKTGGTGIDIMLQRLTDKGYPGLVCLPHGVAIEDVNRKFSRAKAHFLLRDPIERAVSGFMSRLRMGRPAHYFPWDAGEAAAFLYFKDAKEWLAAIDSDDDRLKSAAVFASVAVPHLAHNYTFYFKSLEAARANASRYGLIGEIDRMNDFVGALLGQIAPEIADASSVYEKKHVAPTSSKGALDHLSSAQRDKVMAFFAPEYEIYNYLKTLVNC